ncbi:MAG TPA: hypothetical protein PLM21_07380 [Fervidobacterium sp.]|nr:hypothetical protein [Fervidobacterium sp.]HQG01372.1 hypothetical protein [Fervidobacterium sp.]
MKRRWMYVILATFFTVFFLYSCTSPTTTNSKEVTIVVDRTGVNRNATLILAQDGLNGDWEELTGSGGIYKFTVDDPNGVYSVAAVDDPNPDYEPQIQLFHSTLAEARTITLELWPDDTDFATLTVNVPAEYATENVSVFFLKHHEPNSWLEDSSTTVNIPKGKGTLVAIISDREDSNSPLKVYIKRDFNFLASGSLTISSSDLKNPAEEITGEITYSWLLDKTLVPGHLNWNMKIPEDVMNSSDKYMAEYLKWEDDIFISWWKVTRDVPVTIKPGITDLEPATTTITATAVENNLPNITFSPYVSTISDYSTRYYDFDISKKVTIGDYTYQSETHEITLTPGYLAAASNVYMFPDIDLASWEEYKPTADYVIQSLGICLSPNTIDEMNSLKLGSEWAIFYSYLD